MDKILVIKLYNRDPLLKFLRDKLRLNWMSMLALWPLIWLLDSLFFSYKADFLQSTPRMVGFIEDIPGQLVTMIVCTGMLAFYIWNADSFMTMFWKLYSAGAVESQSKGNSVDYIQALNRLDGIWNRKFWTVSSFLLSLVWFGAIYIPIVHLSFLSSPKILWWAVSAPYHTYWLMKMFFFTYVGFRIFIILLLGVYSLFQLANWEILKYQWLHPDGAGGLQAIGQYQLGFVYLLSSLGVFYIFIALRSQLGYLPLGAVIGPLNPVDLVLYVATIIAIPLFYFVPMFKMHHFMKLKKTIYYMKLPVGWI